MNLLQETLGDMKRYGYTPQDVIFIGSQYSGHSCTWQEFETLANIEYDNSYGSQEIAADLIIVFKDLGKMYRHEYDGEESWRFSPPPPPAAPRHPRAGT